MRTAATLALVVPLFVLGLLVPSEPYQLRISGGEASALEMIRLVGAIILYHGWFNTLLLSVGAAYIGTSARPPGSPVSPVRGAVAIGFFVWLLLIGGKVYFEADIPSVVMNQAEYVKLALTMMGLSFVAGRSPTVLATLLRRFEGWAAKGDDPLQKGSQPANTP